MEKQPLEVFFKIDVLKKYLQKNTCAGVSLEPSGL